MGRLTDDRPKCLLEVRGGTILSVQIDLLLDCGIDEFVITLGPFDGLVREYVLQKYGNLNVSYVFNPVYASTNYIYSMFLAERYVKSDSLLLLHGDLIMERSVCEKILKHPADNAVIVDPAAPLPEKDFKGRITNGIVVEIGTRVFGNDCVFLLPLYRLSMHGMGIWLGEIRRFVDSGRTEVYAENAFNECSEKIGLEPVALDHEVCMEIDTEEDYRLAIKLLGDGGKGAPD